MIIQKLRSIISGESHETREANLYTNLIRHEAKIGGQLFGPQPKGGKREFFCLDERTWIWHEEWIDENGKQHIKTTRYDVRPDAILKAQDGSQYHKVSDSEVARLKQATKLYRDRIYSELYANYV